MSRLLRHILEVYYEILFRLELLLFAIVPDIFSVIHIKIDELTVQYGSMGLQLLEKRILIPNLLKAM